MAIKKNYFWNTPLTYKGKTYPANAEELVDENGNLVTKNVFADANGGRHFINDDGTLTDVYMNSGELPEVTVTAPIGETGMRNKMADAYRLNVFNAKGPLGYLQFENNLQNNLLQRQAMMKAAGYNVPQNGYWNDEQEEIWNKLTTRDKEYDTTLLGFLQGMADKSNGNTTYMSDPLGKSEINQYNTSDESPAAKWKTLKSNNKVVNAIAGTWGPVAATSLAAPYAVEAADALAGTTAGQAISNGLNFATKAIGSNKAWPFLDAGITSYFGAEGINDIRNGKFTPETAVNLLPFLQMARPVAEESKAGFDFIRNWRPKLSLSSGNGVNKTTAASVMGNSNPNITSIFSNFGNAKEKLPPFTFGGFVMEPLEMHKMRAIAKGYDPSKVPMLNVAEDTPQVDAFLDELAKVTNMPRKDAKHEVLDFLGRNGHAAVARLPNRTIAHDGKAGGNESLVLSHELDHALHDPAEQIPSGVLDSSLTTDQYFVNHNNTEIAARGSQLHDYFGHTGKEPITEEMLKYARDHYVKDTGVDNDMSALLHGVKDYKKLAEWMTKYATGIIPFVSLRTINNKD